MPKCGESGVSVSLTENIAKAEEAMPPIWVRKQETPKTLYEQIQRRGECVAHHVQDPGPSSTPGVAAANPKQL